jgi:hypothetical protein
LQPEFFEIIKQYYFVAESHFGSRPEQGTFLRV